MLLELHCNYLSPEVCVEDVSGLVTGGMSEDLVTMTTNKRLYRTEFSLISLLTASFVASYLMPLHF